MTFSEAFQSELEKIAVAGRVGQFFKAQLGGLGVPKYKHLLDPGEQTLTGVAKSYLTHPIRTFKETAKKQEPLTTFLTPGFAAMEAPAILNAQSGEERGKAIGRAASTMAIGFGHPVGKFRILPSLALWSGGGALVERAGGAIGRRLSSGSSSMAELQSPYSM